MPLLTNLRTTSSKNSPSRFSPHRWNRDLPRRYSSGKRIPSAKCSLPVQFGGYARKGGQAMGSDRAWFAAFVIPVTAALVGSASYPGRHTPLGEESPTGEPVGKSNPYEVVHGWPVPPEGFMFGHVTGVGVDSHNQVFVFHRADHSIFGKTFDEPISSPVVTCFDGKTGELVASWGANLFLNPHGLRLDQADNVWVTDLGLQQVLKFSHDGKLLMTVGEKSVPGLDGKHFNRPTDVAVAPDGSFYVSDGYGNSRVARFSSDGKFIGDWGH